MLSRAGIGRRASILIVFLLIGLVVAACGGAGAILSTVGAPVGGAPVGGGNFSGGPAATSAPVAGPVDVNGDGEFDAYELAGTTDLQIIKTGSMVLQVAGVDDALNAATAKVKELGGYVSGSERTGDEESDQATLVLRIPAANWEPALTALRGLATKILDERSTTEDVTTQIVDLGARIKNLEATEHALQGIMDRATEIKDVLAVQAELTQVRGQIETMAAEKAHLTAQAAYSTLSVTFSLKPDPVQVTTEKFDPATVVDEASASLVDVLQGLATAGIWFGIVWLPILITLGIVFGIGMFIFRRIRRTPGAMAPTSGGDA